MDLSLLFPIIILILFIPLFLSSRKQKRQMAAMQALQKALEPGDVVTTTSGLRGTVVDASYEDTVDLEIADDVVTTWLRAAVRDKVADAATATPGAAHPVDAEPAPPDAVPPAVGKDGASLDGPDGHRPTAAHADGAVDPTETPSDANGSARP